MGVMRVSGFSLIHTLDSGQFFRYHLHDGWYYIVTREKVFRARQDADKLFFEGASERFVRHFFGLDENYLEIMHQLSKDPALRIAIKKYPGLRIIKQDPWECTVGFLCSQFSNIKKIKRNMECIAEKFGKEVVFKGKKFFTFPSAGELNDVAKLKKCAVGFRAKYIAGVNARVSDEWFAGLRKLTYKQAREKLMALPGIGEKVADCICLFSLGFTESFPVDVWMERAVKELYPEAKKMKLRQMGEFGRKKWGRMAGYAQQYLYHWRRMHGNARRD
ncbi:MAG: DNA glycosylase [Candidatus Woesearchaeota archaeon]